MKEFFAAYKTCVAACTMLLSAIPIKRSDYFFLPLHTVHDNNTGVPQSSQMEVLVSSD
jgi:hypothetical protein